MKNKFVKFLYSGSPQVIIVKNVVLAVIIYLLYRIIRNAIVKTDSENIANLQNQQIEAIQNGEVLTNDNSTLDQNSDLIQANEIALQQYSLMNQFFIDEQALFDGLKNLNGSQLQQVYVAYGIKDGKNLFQWYNDKLNSQVLTGNVYTYDGDDSTECNSYFDFCSELDVMRLVWKKSGLIF